MINNEDMKNLGCSKCRWFSGVTSEECHHANNREVRYSPIYGDIIIAKRGVMQLNKLGTCPLFLRKRFYHIGVK